ncbi:MAG TPA: peptidoglycan DD-metalloendopeptidase family protein [Stellaceae bacterium]|nr:peptidoglycan DD-metalloendopeptidase family protein [Stellaceae bacterium]
MWRLFPERQILVRAEGRVSYLTLSRRAQLVMAVAVVAGSGFVAYTTTHTFRLKPDQVELAQRAPSDAELLARIETLRRQLDEVNAQLAQASAAPKTQDSTSVEDAQTRIGALESARDRANAEQQELKRQLEAAQEAANAKSQNLVQLNRTLDANRGELRQSDAQRANLQGRVRQLESELENANARTNQYKSELASNERRLQQLAAEHERIVAERDRLQARLVETQSRPPTLNLTPPSDVTVAPPPAPNQRSQAERTPDQRSDNATPVSELERLIASTGIDVEKLLTRFGSVPSAQGGPYVALDRAARPNGPSAARLEELQKLIKTLPLAAPLAHYQIESGFGGRADPFHGRQAFHAGVDLSAPYRTPVLSTAPGVVVFTGVKDNYGKVVEIDHGHGIVTRYAHMHRSLVALGQKVGLRQPVGELGSTGRSTGPHLHYEVLVNGTAQDPEKFMQAGKNVVQASGK